MKKLVVEKEKLIENINTLQAEAKKTNTHLMAMLKGNGYGLGLCAFAHILAGQGVDAFCVCQLEEARALRESGITSEILLLSPTCDLEEATEAIELNITCAVGSYDSCSVLDIAAERLGKKAKAHLAIDTGFGRFGFLYTDAADAALNLNSLEFVEITGTFTHLSDAFGGAKNSELQFKRFMQAVNTLKENGLNPGLRHICNSCGFLRFSQYHLDAVRVGSAFLGRLPMPAKVNLHKIAYLESRICEAKWLPKGFNVGYANTYTTKRPTKIGIIPVGYMDGFGVSKTNDTFRFSDILRYTLANVKSLFKDNAVYVHVNGKPCRVLGRISMFNIIADITDVEGDIGDRVVLQCNPILIDASVMREYI